MQSSVREIRTRLLSLLLRAFAFVLFLSLIFFLTVISYFLTSQRTPISMPFTTILEGYYIGHQSWDGAEVAFDSINELNGENSLLLDKDQRIILDHDSDPATVIGSIYESQPNDLAFPLVVNGQTVGTLVIPTLSPFGRLGIARAVIFPVSIISLLLSIFLIIISTLLVQRYINPLADVIFAAREMSRGKLSTRIAGTGPQDLRSLSDSFNEMAASLERNDRERREMLADVAHELRTPLSVIRGRLEGIVDGIYQDNGTQVSMALEQTYLLERLVDDLRLLTLAETRQLQFDKTDVQISELIQKVVDIFSAEAAEKGIALSFNNNSKAKTFPVDPQRLEQVISNLIGNALRYIPDNGKISVTTKDSANGISITVSDNGAGIPEADLPFIFDRFWRKDRSRSRSSGGTGLGLAIAKQLIEAQGGTIQAKNNPEGGLHVEIELKN